jgi:multiple sugar transport system permease protein
MTKSLRAKQALKYIILIIVSAWVIFPIYWVIITSFKYPIEVYEPTLIPFLQFKPILTNWIGGSYGEIATVGEIATARGALSREILRALFNSFAASITSSFICLLIGIPAAYGLARFTYHKWKNKDIHSFILSLRFLPPFAVIIPFFMILSRIKLIDTIPGLIMIYVIFNLPLAVVLLKDIISDLPSEIEEAAMLDGSSRIEAMLRITLPLVAPSLVATFLICFVFAWNELMFALTVTYTKAKTMPVMIAAIETAQATEFWTNSCWVVLAILPPIIIAMLAERYIIRGLTLGAVKG